MLSRMANQPKLIKQFHCVHLLNYHLVVATKYRRRVLTGEMMARLRAIAVQRCVDWGGDLLEMNGESDHAHFLLRLPPSVAPASFVNNLKTTSSRLLRKEFAEHVNKFYWKPVFWSRSYCIISCGGAPLSVVKQYIENQRQD